MFYGFLFFISEKMCMLLHEGKICEKLLFDVKIFVENVKIQIKKILWIAARENFKFILITWICLVLWVLNSKIYGSN